MKEQLISFETAKLAKDKGFKINTRKGYIYRFKEHESEDYVGSLTHDPLTCDIGAPTQSLLQKWLREKYNIDIIIMRDGISDDGITMKYYPWIFTEKNSIDWKGIFKDTYEKTLEKGLQEALKLIEKL
jgi:hypothetical protein